MQCNKLVLRALLFNFRLVTCSDTFLAFICYYFLLIFYFACWFFVTETTRINSNSFMEQLLSALWASSPFYLAYFYFIYVFFSFILKSRWHFFSEMRRTTDTHFALLLYLLTMYHTFKVSFDLEPVDLFLWVGDSIFIFSKKTSISRSMSD